MNMCILDETCCNRNGQNFQDSSLFFHSAWRRHTNSFTDFGRLPHPLTNSSQKLSVGFKSGLWAGHSSLFTVILIHGGVVILEVTSRKGVGSALLYRRVKYESEAYYKMGSKATVHTTRNIPRAAQLDFVIKGRQHDHKNQASVLPYEWYLSKQQFRILEAPGVCGPSVWCGFFRISFDSTCQSLSLRFVGLPGRSTFRLSQLIFLFLITKVSRFWNV
ncbi:hypothetical protein TNCV_3456191 [Trichonephila clavipes]|nr:hypothetical protein TNCV_3456191 [Trichonephila clavipes]